MVDFVLRNTTLYEERTLFVFLETCHFERSWLSAFRRIEVMFEGMKYFSFLFCFWGKNPGVRIQRLNFAGDNNHDRNMPDEMIKMGPFTETFVSGRLGHTDHTSFTLNDVVCQI